MLSGARTLGPVFAAALGPVMVLSRAVWGQLVPTSMLRSTFEWNVKVAKNWSDVRGPIGAAVKSLQRVGFTLSTFTEWVSEAGEQLNLAVHSPWT
eukprot:3738747-Pyramimonas_sp.AAC.1